MESERESLVDAALATLGVVVFIAVVVVAGSMTSNGLSEAGTFTVVGGIVVFLAVMAGIGFYLSTRD